MAIGFRAAGAYLLNGDPGTSFAPALPTGSAANDIVLWYSYFDGGTNITWTPPSGWTLANRTNNSTTNGMVCYWAVWTGSLSSSFTCTSCTACGFILGYTGVDNGTPMDVTAVGQNNASSSTVTVGSITTVTNNAWPVWCGGIHAQSTSWSGQTWANDRQHGATSLTSDPFAMDAGDSGALVTAGASGSQTATSSVAGASIGITVALRPAATPSFTGYAQMPVFWQG